MSRTDQYQIVVRFNFPLPCLTVYISYGVTVRKELKWKKIVICPGSILLANPLRTFRKENNSPENFVRQSLANIARLARITNLTKF